MNEYVLFCNMRTIRRKIKKNKYNPSFASKTIDKILKTALDPDHINESLAAIKQVNAEIAGKPLSMSSVVSFLLQLLIGLKNLIFYFQKNLKSRMGKIAEICNTNTIYDRQTKTKRLNCGDQ